MLSIALISFFSLSAFSVGVSTSKTELETPTLGDDSAYSLNEITNPTGDYITKYLENTDGTYTAIYYQLVYDTTSTPTLNDGNYIGNGIGNTESSNGGAIYSNDSTIGSITGDFIYNTASHSGGAIYNDSSTISTITGDFIGNKATSTSGGAIYNNDSSTIKSILGDFIENYADDNGGAIYNDSSSIESITGDFVGNYASDNGGAIYNKMGTITLSAIDSDINFTGNYTGSEGNYSSNAIYNYSTSSTAEAVINFSTGEGKKIVVNDAITGGSHSTSYVDYQILNISGAGTVEFNNSVSYQTINVESGTLKLGSYAGSDTADASIAKLDNVALTLKSEASLRIGTDKSNSSVVLSNSSFEMQTGSSIFFSAYSSLTLENSTVSIGDLASVIIDLSGVEIDTYTYTLIYTDDTSISKAIYTALLSENIEIITSTNAVASDIQLTTSGTNLLLTVVLSSVAVPEPSTYAMIIGILALGFAAYRRRK